MHESCPDTVSRVPGSVGTEHTDSQSSALWLPEDTTMYVEGCQHGEEKIFYFSGWKIKKYEIFSVCDGSPEDNTVAIAVTYPRSGPHPRVHVH